MQVIWCLKFFIMTKSGGGTIPPPLQILVGDLFSRPPVIYAHKPHIDGSRYRNSFWTARYRDTSSFLGLTTAYARYLCVSCASCINSVVKYRPGAFCRHVSYRYPTVFLAFTKSGDHWGLDKFRGIGAKKITQHPILPHRPMSCESPF